MYTKIHSSLSTVNSTPYPICDDTKERQSLNLFPSLLFSSTDDKLIPWHNNNLSSSIFFVHEWWTRTELQQVYPYINNQRPATSVFVLHSPTFSTSIRIDCHINNSRLPIRKRFCKCRFKFIRCSNKVSFSSKGFN